MAGALAQCQSRPEQDAAIAAEDDRHQSLIQHVPDFAREYLRIGEEARGIEHLRLRVTARIIGGRLKPQGLSYSKPDTQSHFQKRARRILHTRRPKAEDG